MKLLLVAVLLATAGCDRAMTIDEWREAKKVCTDQELYPRERIKFGGEVFKIDCLTPQGNIVEGLENPE